MTMARANFVQTVLSKEEQKKQDEQSKNTFYCTNVGEHEISFDKNGNISKVENDKETYYYEDGKPISYKAKCE